MRLWLDVAQFEQSFALVQQIAGKDLNAQEVQTLESAVQLYRGPLLDGWYQDWCLYERDRLQNIYLALLDKLMEHSEAHFKYEAGLEYGERILHYNRACERTHQRLMRLHYLAGNRSAALRQYDLCVTTLDEELNVQASKQTQSLYEHIQADRLDNAFLRRTQVGKVPEEVISQLHDILDRITHLGTTLTDLQRQVQQTIQTIERSSPDQR
jgi:DNA-binding SARP family transcriptional activator